MVLDQKGNDDMIDFIRYLLPRYYYPTDLVVVEFVPEEAKKFKLEVTDSTNNENIDLFCFSDRKESVTRNDGNTRFDKFCSQLECILDK
jgi:hypothetical protein